MPLKLAIIDDDVRLSQILKSDLLGREEIDSVITHHSGLTFAKELEQITFNKRPDIIIMDISMAIPDEGIVATRLIKKKFPEIGIIMFTVSDEDDRIFEAFKAGAMGYLLKNESADFILKTIIDVKQGGAQMSPSIARKTIQFMVPLTSQPSSEPEEDTRLLSTREIEILEYVSKGFTYAQIADQLFISFNTVKKHMGNIFGKLHVKNKIGALKKTEGLH